MVLYTKFEGHQPSDFEEDFKGFYHTHTRQCLRRIADGNVGLPLDTT